MHAGKDAQIEQEETGGDMLSLDIPDESGQRRRQGWQV